MPHPSERTAKLPLGVEGLMDKLFGDRVAYDANLQPCHICNRRGECSCECTRVDGCGCMHPEVQ